MSTPYFKACPNCRRQCPLAQEHCDGCGHVFRTHFTPDDLPDGGRTVVVPAGHVVAPPGEQVPIYCTRCRARIDISVIQCPICGWDQRQYSQSAPPQYGQPYPQYPQYPPAGRAGDFGYSQAQAPMPPHYRSDIIQLPPGTFNTTASILCAFFFTGVGQMCNRQTAKGVVILISAILLALPTLYIGPFVLWFVALIDAIQIANRLHRGEPVGQWQWF